MKNRVSIESMGSAPVAKLLPKFAIPAIIATASTSLFNIIDTIFIGNGVGALAISGVAVTLPLMNILAAFGAMVGIGSAARVSIRLGEGRIETARTILSNALFLALFFSFAITLPSLIFLDDILYFFGASANTLGYSRDFMQVMIGGSCVTAVFLTFNEIIRASGSPGKSMSIVLASVCLNITLNPLFIFVFGLGVRGSAMATILSQGIALIISITHFTSGRTALTFDKRRFRPDWEVIASILSIGIAPFLLHFFASAVALFVNRALMGIDGDFGIGAYGITNRVVLLFIMIIAGLNQGMQPIVGYNFGARNLDRVFKALRITILCGITVSSVGFLVGQFASGYVARIFVDESSADGVALVAATELCMRSVTLAFPFVGLQIVSSNFFQYIGRARLSIILTMTRQVIFLIPLLIILPPRLGIVGVWYSIPIADFSATVLASVILSIEVRRLRREFQM